MHEDGANEDGEDGAACGNNPETILKKKIVREFHIVLIWQEIQYEVSKVVKLYKFIKRCILAENVKWFSDFTRKSSFQMSKMAPQCI